MMFLENDPYIGRSLDVYQEANFFEVEFLKKLLAPDDVVIDVGANFGTITVPLAQTVPEGYVVAVEAQPFLFNCLCGNVALNHLTNVQPMNRAAASVSGKPFFMPTLTYKEEGFNYGGFGLTEQLGEEKNGRVYSKPVSSITIDDMRLSRVKLIKIDVEGMESEVLVGAQSTIERCKPYLYVELAYHCEHILDLINQAGYEAMMHVPPLFNPDNKAGKDENILVNDHGPMVSGNIFCFRKEDWPTLREAKAVISDSCFVSFEQCDEKIKQAREEIYGE
jgi:FkbM family methyltransferase